MHGGGEQTCDHGGISDLLWTDTWSFRRVFLFGLVVMCLLALIYGEFEVNWFWGNESSLKPYPLASLEALFIIFSLRSSSLSSQKVMENYLAIRAEDRNELPGKLMIHNQILQRSIYMSHICLTWSSTELMKFYCWMLRIYLNPITGTGTQGCHWDCYQGIFWRTKNLIGILRSYECFLEQMVKRPPYIFLYS